MKKILSVMLAIMMLLGAVSVSASAADLTVDDYKNMINDTQVIVVFDFNGGKSKKPLPVFNREEAGNKFVLTEEVSGTYYMLPGAGGNNLTANTVITLPSVTPPEGKAFVGWDCALTEHDYTAGARFFIEDDILAKAHESYSGIIYMTAMYEAAEPEEDTMATVLGILMKVFGTIIGILFLDGSSEAGIELMEKVLGGIL